MDLGRTALIAGPLVTLTALAAACEGPGHHEEASPEGQAVRYVGSLETEPPTEWTLAPEPSLRLGEGSEATVLFHRIDQVLTLGDGSILIGDRGDGRIHRFDSVGQRLETLGGMGFGPGEFRTLSGTLHLEPDSLLVFDAAAMRVTLLTLDGEVVDTRRLVPPDGLDAGLSTYRLVGLRGLDRMVLVPGGALVRARPAPEPFTESLPILEYDRSGRFVGALPRPWVIEMWGDTLTSLVRPFGRRTVVATQGGTMWIGDAYDGWIERWDATGPATILELADSTGSSPDMAREAWIESQVGGILDEGLQQQERRRLEAVPAPPQIPLFTDLALGPSDRIWLRRAGLPGSPGPARWSVLEPAGGRVAEVHLPQDFRLADIQPDRVLGVWTDAMGVESVRVYPLGS